MAQGLICAILLLWHRPAQTSRTLLAFVLLTFIVLSFKILIHTLGLWQRPHWRYLPLAFDLLIQPLFYLYALSLTQKNYRLQQKTWLHFLPVLLFLCHAIWVYLASRQTDDIAAKDVLAEALYYNRIKEFEDILSIISGIVYWVLSFRQISMVKKQLSNAIEIDKVYLDTELSLSSLAKQIGVAEGILSTVINEEFHQNFRNFINKKRVEELNGL